MRKSVFDLTRQLERTANLNWRPSIQDRKAEVTKFTSITLKWKNSDHPTRDKAEVPPKSPESPSPTQELQSGSKGGVTETVTAQHIQPKGRKHHYTRKLWNKTTAEESGEGEHFEVLLGLSLGQDISFNESLKLASSREMTQQKGYSKVCTSRRQQIKVRGKKTPRYFRSLTLLLLIFVFALSWPWEAWYCFRYFIGPNETWPTWAATTVVSCEDFILKFTILIFLKLLFLGSFDYVKTKFPLKE